MHHQSAPHLAALALAGALAMSGCGSAGSAGAPAKTFPGVGQPNPNGQGLIVSEGVKSPGETPANAKRQDIHSFKEFQELTKNCHSLADYEKLLGPFQIALTGRYAGYAIYPNYFYDSWFVASIALTLGTFDGNHVQLNNDPLALRNDPIFYEAKGTVMVKEIAYIRPEQMAWFTPAVEKPASP